jgi:hypothetical protein
MVYRARNIGDMIQTMALSRLVPPMGGVFRHDLNRAPFDHTFIVNGYLGPDRPPRAGSASLFAGVSGPYGHRRGYLRWMRESLSPVGARDPVTAERLKREGVSTDMVGCATLTFPPYVGARQGVLSVDCDGPGERLTHWISRNMSVAQQWNLALQLLARYRTAEAVYTSRLHVALPCLAFGTPVWITQPTAWSIPERYSLLDCLGVPYARLVGLDVSQHATRYRDFLAQALRTTLEPHDPVMPMLAVPDRLGLSARVRFVAKDTLNDLRHVRRRLLRSELATPVAGRENIS